MLTKDFKQGDMVYLAFDYGSKATEIEKNEISKIDSLHLIYLIKSGCLNSDEMLFHTYDEAADYVLNSHKEHLCGYIIYPFGKNQCEILFNVIKGMENQSQAVSDLQRFLKIMMERYDEIDYYFERVRSKLEEGIG